MRFFCAAAAALMLSFSVLASESTLPATDKVKSLPTTSMNTLTPKSSYVKVASKRKCMERRKRGDKSQDLRRHILLCEFSKESPNVYSKHEPKRLLRKEQSAVQRSTSVPKTRPELKLSTESRSLTSPRERPNSTTRERQSTTPRETQQEPRPTTSTLPGLIQAAQSMAQMLFARREHNAAIKMAFKIIDKYPMASSIERMTEEEYKICLACAYLVDYFEVFGMIYPTPLERSARVKKMYLGTKERFLYLKDLKSRVIFHMKKK